MTLKEWAALQKLAVRRHPKYFNSFWVPDSNLVQREEAYHLEDYVVSSVSGGSMWFSPRNPITEVRP